MMLEPDARAALRMFLEQQFNLGELEALAFDLGTNYQTLPHATTAELSMALIDHFEHRGTGKTLWNTAQALRPHVDIAALYPKMAADAPRHPVPDAAKPGIQAGLPDGGIHRTARSEEAQMSSRTVDWLQLLANVVQIVSLPISLLLVMRPDLITGFHVSPLVLQAAFVVLLTLFLMRLLAPRRRRVQAQRRQREAHRFDQLPQVDRMAVAVDEHVRVLPLAENYVEPRLQHTGQLEKGTRATEEWRPLRILRHTVAAGQAGVVIWGMAGAGKTMLARWLAQQIALAGDRDAWRFLQRRVMDETPSDNARRRRVLDWRARSLRWLGLEPSEYDLYYPYVFYVELSQKDFGKDTRSGADAILACLEKSVHLSDVSALARRKRILPIFDGFDQLTLDGQGQFLICLQEFLRQYRGNEPFILTSRHPLRDDQIRDLGVDQRVAQWQVLPFNSAQVQQYIEKYYSRGGGLQADRTEKLWQAIRKTAQASSRVWQLLAEPMLLGMIAFTFDPLEETIDTDRVTIYERYLEKLVLRRHPDADSAKSNAVKADVQRVRKLLGAVAYRELLAQRTVFPVAQMTADEQRALMDFEGILTWATSESSFTFSHMTMQCFFAAVHLDGQLEAKDLPPDAARNLWRETVGRSVASAGDRRPKDNSDDERWRAYWRDALVMAAGMLTPRAVGRKLEDDWIYPAVQGVRSGAPRAQSRVLFLRLLGAIRERSPLPSNAIGQESLVSWLSALARPEALATDAWWYWQRDIGEVGELLTPEDWQELTRQAGIPESAD